MRVWSGPRVVVFSAASSPRVPGLDDAEKTSSQRGKEVEEDHDEENPPESRGAKRGEIRHFTKQSALSLARLLSSIDWTKHGECVHVTLTYHKDWPSTKEQLAKSKAYLVTALGRKVKCGVWRLEFQKRGAPHYHCLVWLPVEQVESFTAWVSAWWARRTANTTGYGCHCTSGRPARAAWYLALHAAKGVQGLAPFPPGRWWGYINRPTFIEAVDLRDSGEVSDMERIWFARLYRRSTGGRTQHGVGFSWFLPRHWQARVSVWIRRTCYEKDPF